MKVKFLFAALLSASLMFSGCGKDDDDAPATTTPAATSSMSAKVDGTDWKAVTPVANTNNGSFTLAGSNAANQSVSMAVQGATAPGTFTNNQVIAVVSEGNMSWSNIMSGTASVTISKLDMTAKKASGTFSFTADGVSGGATGTKTVTNGTFTDVAIQ